MSQSVVVLHFLLQDGLSVAGQLEDKTNIGVLTPRRNESVSPHTLMGRPTNTQHSSELFLNANSSPDLAFYQSLREGYKVRKKKKSGKFQIRVREPPLPNLEKYNLSFLKASGIILSNFGKNNFFPLKNPKILRKFS